MQRRLIAALLAVLPALAQAAPLPGELVNVSQINGFLTSTGPGASNGGTIRVIIASDSPAQSITIGTTTIVAPNNNTTPIPVTGSVSVAFTTVTIATPNNNTTALPVSLASLPAVTIGTGSITAYLTAAQLATLTPLTSVGVNNFPVSQAVTGTFFQALQPVSLTTGSVTAFQGGAPWTVAAHAISTGSISAFQGGTWNVTAAISGGVTITTGTITAVLNASQLSTLTPLSSISVSNFPASQAVTNTGTFAVQAAQSGTWNVNTTTGSLTAFQGGTWTTAISGGVTITTGSLSVTFPSAQAVTGAFFQALQPVSITTGSVSAFEAGTWTVGLSANQSLNVTTGTITAVLNAAQLSTLTPLTAITITTGSITAFQGGAPWTVAAHAVTSLSTGSVSAFQGGTWNLNVTTGSLSVTFPSAQAVSQNGTWNIGTVTTLPAITFASPQAVTLAAGVISTGSITAFQGGNWTQTVTTGSITATLTAAQLATLTPLTAVNITTGSITAVLNASQLSTLTPLSSISVSNFPASQAVTGTFWQATQPVSVTTVTIAAPNNNTTPIPISGSLSVAFTTVTIAAPNNNTTAIPVSGSFSANGSTLAVVGIGGAAIGVTQSTAGVNSSTIAVVNAVGTNLSVTFPSAQAITLAATNITTGSLTSFQGGTWTMGLSAGQSLTVTTGSISAAQMGTWTVGLSAAQSLNVTTGSITAFLGAGTAEIGNVKNSGTFAVQAAATLAAETTKVIGTVNISASQNVSITTGSLSVTFPSAQPITMAAGVISTGSISAAQMGTWTVGLTASQAINVTTGSITAFQGGAPWGVTQSTFGANSSTIAVTNAIGTNLNVVFPSAQAVTLAATNITTGSVSAVASLGNTNFGKTVVWVTSSAVTAAASSTLVLSSRTATVGKTFYVQYWDVQGSFGNNTSSNTTNMASVQVQAYTTGNTVVSSTTFTSGFAQPFTYWKQEYSEPVPILSQTTFAITIKPNTATSTNWVSNIVGYER